MAMNPGYQPSPYMQQPAPQTTVIVQQPQAMQFTQERDWNSGLCGCFDDMTSCCAVYFCAPCYMCWLSSEMGEGCCMPWLVPYALPALRLKIRSQQNITGSILNDCCITEFCGLCALCQLKREHDHVQRMAGYK